MSPVGAYSGRLQKEYLIFGCRGIWRFIDLYNRRLLPAADGP